jgi:uncharacterized membrane protein
MPNPVQNTFDPNHANATYANNSNQQAKPVSPQAQVLPQNTPAVNQTQVRPPYPVSGIPSNNIPGQSPVIQQRPITNSVPQTNTLQPQRPLQPQANQIPNRPPTYQHVVNQPIQRPTYINPNNFEVKPDQIPAEKLPDLMRAVDKGSPVLNYPHLERSSNQIIINTHQVLKLVLYVVPTINVLVLMFRSIKDKEVLWHSRQSVLMQVIWLLVLFIINSIGGPLISGDGITLALLWNIFCIGVLIYGGAQAYIGNRWRIPIVAEIGMAFIDEKE